MKMAPWAKLIMRQTPKINESPAATTNRSIPFANPAINWRIITVGLAIQSNDGTNSMCCASGYHQDYSLRSHRLVQPPEIDRINCFRTQGNSIAQFATPRTIVAARPQKLALP